MSFRLLKVNTIFFFASNELLSQFHLVAQQLAPCTTVGSVTFLIIKFWF